MLGKVCSFELEFESSASALQGFEEIHVPALRQKPYASGEKDVAIADLPDWMHPAFKGMKTLNRIQSKVWGQASMPARATVTDIALTPCLATMVNHAWAIAAYHSTAVLRELVLSGLTKCARGLSLWRA